MRFTHLFFIFFLGFLPVIQAQEAYIPAIYTTNNGDIIEGLIRDEVGRSALSGIYFKPTKESIPEFIPLEEVASFAYSNNIKFQRETVFFTRRKPQFLDQVEYNLPRTRHDTLLLQSLLKGASDLYVYSEYDMDYFFYSTPESDTLVFAGYPLAIDEYGTGLNAAYINENDYQLNIPRQRNPDGSLSLEMPRYKRGSIINHFKEYSTSLGVNPTIIKRKGVSNLLRLYAFAEVGTGDATTSLGSPRPAPSNFLAISGGIQLEILTPFSNRRFSFLVDASYTSWSTDYDISTAGNPFTIQLDERAFRLRPGIRYYLIDDKAVNLHASIYANLPPINKQEALINANNGGVIRVDLSQFYLDQIFELGISINRLKINARYYTPRPLVSSLDTILGANRVRQLGIGISYLFF